MAGISNPKRWQDGTELPIPFGSAVVVCLAEGAAGFGGRGGRERGEVDGRWPLSHTFPSMPLTSHSLLTASSHTTAVGTPIAHKT